MYLLKLMFNSAISPDSRYTIYRNPLWAESVIDWNRGLAHLELRASSLEPTESVPKYQEFTQSSRGQTSERELGTATSKREP